MQPSVVLDKYAEEILKNENAAQVSVVLRTAHQEIQTNLNREGDDYVDAVLRFNKEIKKAGMNSSGMKSFMCGQYYTQITDTLSRHKERQSQTKMKKTIKNQDTKTVVEYLAQHDMPRINELRANLDMSEENMQIALNRLISSNMVSVHYMPTETCYSLTVKGKVYVDKHYANGKEWIE